MNALGPLAKLAAVLIGKQPEEQRLPRGFLGLELSEARAGAGPRVVRVLAGSPAAEAGVREGDRLVAVGDREVADLKAARAAVAEVRPGDRVRLTVRRDGVADESLTVTAGEGL
jgi:S1-C subfamily serine protease